MEGNAIPAKTLIPSNKGEKEEEGHPIQQCECIAQLFENISKLYNNNSNSTSSENCENCVSWSEFFDQFIVRDNELCTLPSGSSCVAHSDDMLWYVTLVRTSATAYDISQIQVFRRQSKNKPLPSDPTINWRETTCLNIVLQQLDYFVTCAVCSKQDCQFRIISRSSQQVYPSPSKRRMDTKGMEEKITYPKIYFAIDNFEEYFSNVIVSKGECVCVELIARDRYHKRDSVIFLGSIRHEILRDIYDQNNGKWNWAQKLISSSAIKQRYEFVNMRGPKGKGLAEMAVAKVASCGFETPMSEIGFDFRNEENNASNRRSSAAANGGLFNRLFSGSLRRSALHNAPTVCNTPTQVGQRSRRWLSDAGNINNGQDSDLEDYGGGGAQSPIIAASANNNGAAPFFPNSWSVRGIGQAFSFLRENDEAERINAYLTFITLPWTSILEDVLAPSGRKPIFTFDLFLPQIPRN